jgi:hypothetical protein
MKMLVLPAMMFLNGKIDFKDPQVLSYTQMGFISVAVLVGTVYAYIYTRITANKDQKIIWVPPKAAGQLPFGLGPPPTSPKPADFKKTTYPEHETELLRESATQLAMNVAMSFFMAYQFKVYFSLLVQSVMLPLNLYDFILFKKYILGVTKNSNGTSLYREHFKEPTEQSIAAAERLEKALESGNTEDVAVAEKEEEEKLVPSKAESSVDPSEPRVVDLSDEDEKKEKKNKQESKKSASKAESKKSDMQDLD